jgi:ATP-dependent DNA helicase RecQ
LPTPPEILKQYWNYNSFRPLQQEIVENVLQGKDTLALLPTGGGKSICFQVPALAKDGLCLVISPLIALMKDQVENLRKREIPALTIHSGMNLFEVKQTLQNAAFGHYKFLYVSPERLETDLFKEYLGDLKLNLIAVDEAHCISQWGYDFRPPYLRIAELRKVFPDVPIIALTASATPKVQEDICDKLLFKEQHIFRHSFERANLSFSVFKVDSKINKLLDVLRKVGGSVIVYTRNRKGTKEIAHLLNLNKISADYYHAGLTQQERNQKQEDWINNKTEVIVCTNAFGMGIDKPDVRLVIHMDIPDNLENYYQEAGRAGRDGKRSFAVLIYTNEEFVELQKLPDVKYPTVSEIKKVYEALVNHLQIPVRCGEGTYYDFDLNDFVRYFKLNIFLVINALKALEQDGHLTFNEQVFIASKVSFICDKEVLNNFEIAHPHLENTIKYLLRTYQGIFDHITSINENQLAGLTKISTDELIKHLKELQAYGIIEYQPQKETPQIFLVHNRAPSQHLTFNHTYHLQRKEEYKKRVETMESYIRLERECRSKFIGNYFGDTKIKPCGVCDNCLQLKSTPLTADEFTNISQRIFTHLDKAASEMNTLLQNMTGIKKEKVWKVLDYLQAEGKIAVNEKGSIKRAS